MIASAPRTDYWLEVASNIGRQLCRDAIRFQGQCNWLGDAMEFVDGEWRVIHRSFEGDLYSGTSGIALFLARLQAAAPAEPLIRATAEAALCHADFAARRLDPVTAFGLYSGLVGIAYAFSEAAILLGSEEWHDLAVAQLERLGPTVPTEQSLDVLSGSAGAIVGLLALRTRYTQLPLLETAEQHGRLLVERAERSDIGWSWKTTHGAGRNLTGLSHGTAGIAWALWELARVTSDDTFAAAAREAVRYERAVFDPVQRNWPDFRETPMIDQPTPCATAWCHGAPGIGLARERSFALTGDPLLRQEAAVAATTTTRSLETALAGQRGSFCFCHGLAGNAAFLHAYGVRADDSDAVDLAARVGDFGAGHYADARYPWPCGVNGGASTPGLMLGLAGIGHFYLELARPQTPSVTLIHVDP